MRILSQNDGNSSAFIKSYMPDFNPNTFNFKITIGQIILYLLSLTLGGDPSSPSICSLLLLGAKFTPLIVSNYQVHRLILPVMLHGSNYHLLGNLIFQLRFGFAAEKYYGTKRYIAIYLLAGVGGNLLSAYMMPDGVSIGASSSIFGLLALLGIWSAYNWHSLGPGRDCNLIVYGVVMVFEFLISYFTPTIDLYGHVGGYVVGGMVGIVLLQTEEYSRKWNLLVNVCFVAFCVYFAVLFLLLFGVEVGCSHDCHLCNGLKLNPNYG